jgi:hypothetical protein
MKRRMIAIFMCLVSMAIVCQPLAIQAKPYSSASYITNYRSKAIHVVYDDSGSMIKDDGVYLDRWGQAKYAMEVFAAMLEENDTMRVYYMSDYDILEGGNVNAAPKVTILGTDPASTRVSQIHETVTYSANTPFDAVLKAYEDLSNEEAEEKWLVVLTDGEFNMLYGEDNYNIDANSFYSQFTTESEVNIMHFAMGDKAATISADPSRNIFCEQSKNDNEILGKLTQISNQIFNRNILRFDNAERYEFSFDIPMMELLVFAQGADVEIIGISGGSIYEPSETVNVRYSEVAAMNFANDKKVIISNSLVGVIATIEDIPKGAYSLTITGAQTVEIYYKPVVNLGVKLFQKGVEVRDDPVPEGEYQVFYGIVDETGEFFQSRLLGFVSYTAVASNGGREIHLTSGETLSLQPEELSVEVKAQFLEINTAESVLTRQVSQEAPAPPPAPTPPPPVELDVEITAPSDEFTRTNLNDTGTFVVTVKHEGDLLTEEQWNSMDLATVTANANVEIADIRRGAAVSTFEFNLKQKNGDRFQTASGTVTIEAKAQLVCGIHGGNICEGRGSIRVSITNDVSAWEDLQEFARRNWNWLKWLLVFLVVLLLWGSKKRFPNYMAREPKIYCSTGNGTALEYDGRFKKSFFSLVCPLIARRGSISVVGGTDHSLPLLEVKALGGDDMLLTNTQAFVQDALVDCEFYPDGAIRAPRSFDGNITMSCGAEVRTEFLSRGRRFTYRCQLLQKADE